MNKNIDKDIINKEIQKKHDAIDRLRKMIPFGAITMVVFSFIYPLIPGRRSTESLAQWLGYPYAVIACLIVSGLVYLIGYKIAVRRRKREILELERRRDFV